MDEIWKMERDFWLRGIAVYAERLADDCLMALPGVGILDRAQVLGSLRDAARWDSVEMGNRRDAAADSGIIIGYEATAERSGSDTYRAICTSTYLRIGGRWRMAQHQQTPLA